MSAILDALGWGLNQAANVLDKPGAAVRGLLAGRPDQLAHLVPGSDLFGLTSPEDKVSGRDLLRQYGLAGEGDNWGNFLGGMAVDALTNPLTYVGGGAAKSLMGGGKAGPLGGLRNLRQNFTVAKGVDEAGQAARLVGGTAETKMTGQALAGLLPEQAGVQGMMVPGERAAAVMRGAPGVTGRHETVHGLVDEIARHGASGEGAPWLVRLAGGLKRGAGDTGVRAGLGQAADELAAFTLENRGLWDQAKGAANFLFNPWLEGRAGYAADFARRSPLVGAAYKYLPHATAAAGTGAATSPLLAALRPE